MQANKLPSKRNYYNTTLDTKSAGGRLIRKKTGNTSGILSLWNSVLDKYNKINIEFYGGRLKLTIHIYKVTKIAFRLNPLKKKKKKTTVFTRV